MDNGMVIGVVDGESLEVLGVEYGVEDKIIVRDIDTKKVSACKIYHNSNRSFFRKYGRRIDMANILRLF